MSAVALIYVGAVLFVNGIFLLGRISPKGAAPLNIFVGSLMVLTPTFMIFTSGGEPGIISSAAGLYLFGFTNIWVGINNALGWRPEGLGWYSLFVAICTLSFAAQSGFMVGDWPFAVLWLQWGVLWFLFFQILALGRDDLAPYTGAVCLGQAFITAAVPGELLVFGMWRTSVVTAVVLAILGLVNFGIAVPLSRRLTVPVPLGDG